MISQDTVKEVVPLAEKATKQGLTLVAEADTPLKNLCDLSSVNEPVLLKEEEPVTSLESIDDAAIVEYTTDASTSNHNTEIDSLVEQLTGSIAGHLSFARNIVLNNVTTYCARVKQDLSELDQDPISEFEIKQVSLPKFLHESNVQDLLNKYSGLNYFEPSEMPYYEAKGPEELTELVMFGTANIDSSIAKWLSNCNPDILTKTWLDFFADPLDAVHANKDDFITSIEKNITGVDTAIAIFLLARGVLEKMPEGSGKDKDQLKRVMDQYLDTVSTRLLRAIRVNQTHNNQGVVVTSVDRLGKKIYVNKEPYLSWLAEGGKNEVLLGCFVSEIRASTKKDLLDNAETALRAWGNFVQVSTTRYMNTRMNAFLSSLRSNFFTMLKDREELEEEMFINPAHLENVTAHFEEEIESVSTNDLNQIELVCTRLMAKGRYYYTDAYRILSDIASLTQENDQLHVKEAATLVMINYVADYVTDQIKVART